MPTSRKAFELRSATSVVCRNIWLFTTVHFAKDFVNFAKLNNYFFLSKKTFQPLGQYAKGMIFLHNNSYIHRDLKSLNILLCSELKKSNDLIELKISDFGLSREFSEDSFMTGQLGTCH